MLIHDALKRFHDLEKRIESLERELSYVRRELANKMDGTKYGGTQFTRGCRVCGLGSDGKSYGYVCNRTDCPTAVTCNLQDAFK